MKKVATPGKHTIADVSGFFGVPPEKLVKTLIYLADGKPVAVMVRGDREVNEIKLAKALGVDTLALAGDAAVKEVTGAPVGFAGPVGLKSRAGLRATSRSRRCRTSSSAPTRTTRT